MNHRFLHKACPVLYVGASARRSGGRGGRAGAGSNSLVSKKVSGAGVGIPYLRPRLGEGSS